MDEMKFMNSFFSDGTEDYCCPTEPGKYDAVTIRFRLMENTADAVCLYTGKSRIPMRKDCNLCGFDYYVTEVPLTGEEFRYRFRIERGADIYHYDRYGACKEDRREYEFVLEPGFSVPKWARGAVMYQIFVDRFCCGNPAITVRNGEYYYINRHVSAVDNWYKYPEDFDVSEFYGGDLDGVIQKLDYLEDLGIEVIYFNPLFVSPSSHKYDTQDYDYIDPHIGAIPVDGGDLLADGETDNRRAGCYRRRVTDPRNLEASNQKFIELVEKAHARGIRVIIDGVFNHCGSFHKWLDREGIYENAAGYREGAYHSKSSPYHDFFHFEDENAFPENTTYEGWWGHDTLPKLNYEGSRVLEQYILDIGAKWVSPPYNADGWRLDVAADLGHSQDYNHRFWKEFRKRVKEANPEALILAEHYGDPSPWLRGGQWDSVMNYDAFMEPISWFLTGMEKHSEEFREDMLGNSEAALHALRHNMSRMLTPSLQCAMNQLSNHDHSRFLTRTNHMVGRAFHLGKKAASQGVNKGVMKEAVVFQMTFPGAPTLYYGDEAGVCGFTDPDNRRTYPWGREDQELLNFHKEIIRIHKENEAFRTGSVRELAMERNMICFARFNRQQQFVIVCNNSDYSKSLHIDVWIAGIPKDAVLEQIMYTQPESFSTRPVQYQLEDGVLTITLPKYSAVILKKQQ